MHEAAQIRKRSPHHLPSNASVGTGVSEGYARMLSRRIKRACGG